MPFDVDPVGRGVGGVVEQVHDRLPQGLLDHDLRRGLRARSFCRMMRPDRIRQRGPPATRLVDDADQDPELPREPAAFQGTERRGNRPPCERDARISRPARPDPVPPRRPVRGFPRHRLRSDQARFQRGRRRGEGGRDHGARPEFRRGRDVHGEALSAVLAGACRNDAQPGITDARKSADWMPAFAGRTVQDDSGD